MKQRIKKIKTPKPTDQAENPKTDQQVSLLRRQSVSELASAAIGDGELASEISELRVRNQ